MRSSTRVNILFAIIAVSFAYYFTILRFQLDYQYGRATLARLLSYSADIPFQYRVLPVWTINSVAGMIPPFHLPPGLWVTEGVPIGCARAAVLIEFASILGVIVAFRYYLGLVAGARPAVVSLLSISLPVTLPFIYLLPRYSPYWSPSDAPALLLFILGLTCLFRIRSLERSNTPRGTAVWVACYYGLFAAGCFNRETILFLALVYLVTAWRNTETGKALLHFGAQVLIWAFAKVVLLKLYGSNPSEGGTFFEDHLVHNLSVLSDPRNYGLILSCAGFAWIPAVAGYRLIRSEFVKRAFLVTIPFILAAILVGSVLEMRIYQELLPLVLPAAILGMEGLLAHETPTETGANGAIMT
jgi:hypothetical protein